MFHFPAIALRKTRADLRELEELVYHLTGYVGLSGSDSGPQRRAQRGVVLLPEPDRQYPAAENTPTNLKNSKDASTARYDINGPVTPASSVFRAVQQVSRVRSGPVRI